MYSPSQYYKIPEGCLFSEGVVPMHIMNLQGTRGEGEKENGRSLSSIFSGNEILYG